MQLGDVSDGEDAAVVQLRRCHLAYAPQSLDRQRVQELQFAAGLDDEQSVWLADAAGHLRQEFGAGDPDRDRQANLGSDTRPEPGGDLDRCSGDLGQPADVEERLVDRDALHEWGGVAEDREDVLARLGVRVEARRDDDRLRAEVVRRASTHRRADPERFRLVACGEHHTAAHDDRLSPQPRLVALLHGGEEGVEVGVQDVRARHEHMFVY